jgi:hypothetical protein
LVKTKILDSLGEGFFFFVMDRVFIFYFIGYATVGEQCMYGEEAEVRMSFAKRTAMCT